ncbi:MAG: hypothetical protein RML15_07435 [Bacteroidota bacterium]|nr:hypothetical protein [Candidatus Kapabacteria bacterium]MCS7303410.1 hypothetical protein [Candidatus Kapabacteria bacterium]MDW8075441.1 hypothetical protein [Bacteroidota bacterium]MDW8272225.1 hypothetical protein [Bacteroidota bacterium]
MELSEQTRAVVAYLQEYSGGNLRKPEDLAVILELCAQRDDAELAQRIITTGAALWRVYRVLRRLRQGDEGYRQLEEEFTLQVNEFRLGIAAALEATDEEWLLERFQSVYMELTVGALRNVVDFAHDFSYLKQLQNQQRWGNASPPMSNQ